MDISKFKLNDMTQDDIDYCNDSLSFRIVNNNEVIFFGLNKARTAWLRHGIEGMDDKIMKSLTMDEKDSLITKIKEHQNLGE
ncbi:MAG: hypothetical protein CO073_04240 [Candidatus Komeilibacteria bacterium CG_4_9_14_0_8_um_filter_36_9]|uniref:Uncharacterized protein n=1 Tax=Candidatus Komeilibacteria bacterium CG_4_9_14_0_8_um_filter_36_9 TaxID=1974473 RepID=A0A2M8DQ93_9BACT|nr:MAG: hypothetical protein CO073_04240 [Candidatus Komeilibacteria bacterium CG_4_9_14_0_8_um_filter_36_9]